MRGAIDNSVTSEYNLIVVLILYYCKKGSVLVNTQYKKGVLELCILSLLKKQDQYGYEISDRLSQEIHIADGTVYPILRKLKSDGLLTTYLQEESGGPPRKYYSLTSLGREAYEKERAEYLQFAQSVRMLLEEMEDE